jgi:hypothetical protein
MNFVNKVEYVSVRKLRSLSKQREVILFLCAVNVNIFFDGRGGPHLLDSWAAYLRWISMVKFMPPVYLASAYYTLHQV